MNAVLFRTFAAGLLVLAAGAAHAATPDIAGLWESFDDQGAPSGYVRIAHRDDGYFGVIERGMPGEAPKYCTACEGPLHGKPLIGMEIITGVQPQGDFYGGGHILDPFSGNVYHVHLTPSADGTHLQVRGYFGIPLIGRTQTWVRSQ
jgi:uncharacterized protein (DUF2147 family)